MKLRSLLDTYDVMKVVNKQANLEFCDLIDNLMTREEIIEADEDDCVRVLNLIQETYNHSQYGERVLEYLNKYNDLDAKKIISQMDIEAFSCANQSLFKCLNRDEFLDKLCTSDDYQTVYELIREYYKEESNGNHVGFVAVYQGSIENTFIEYVDRKRKDPQNDHFVENMLCGIYDIDDVYDYDENMLDDNIVEKLLAYDLDLDWNYSSKSGWDYTLRDLLAVSLYNPKLVKIFLDKIAGTGYTKFYGEFGEESVDLFDLNVKAGNFEKALELFHADEGSFFNCGKSKSDQTPKAVEYGLDFDVRGDKFRVLLNELYYTNSDIPLKTKKRFLMEVLDSAHLQVIYFNTLGLMKDILEDDFDRYAKAIDEKVKAGEIIPYDMWEDEIFGGYVSLTIEEYMDQRGKPKRKEFNH